MSILYAGGLWTIFLVTSVAMGYVWALNLPRSGYKVLLAAALAIIVMSQFLPAAHPFRMRVFEGLHWWFWAIMIAIPVLAYAMLVRWIKKKAETRDDARRN